ncbi:Sec20-domain-containing protein [Podospora fimiseda]|uniref:Sec20-domain-containing protein n=1 Tax=Podospora fimiseda TaxID=252190 RepID=A0AAN7BVX7_9PEZI|nr:Sec20-domain-containing protein [Podospora fimiseda]
MATSFDTLHERLSALQETTNQLKELIHRLATIEFQPGSVPLASEENNVAAELSAEIIQILREEEEDLELLQEEIIDLRGVSEQNKTRLKDAANRLESELKTCHTTFRRAQLSAQASLKSAQKLERSLLLASYAAPQPTSSSSSSQPDGTPPVDPRTLLFANYRNNRTKKTNNDPESSLLNASSDVTLALRRTHALIASSVAKSTFAAQTLEESTAALKALQENYEGLNGLLNKSKDLVGTLLTTTKSDTWYLESAVKILVVTGVWLFWRRILYGPTWWLVWLPVRTVFRTGKGVVNVVGGGGEKATMEVIVPGEGGGIRKTTVVGVGEEGAVPTIEIERPVVQSEERGEGEEESMIEKVGRIVEEQLDYKEGLEGLLEENGTEEKEEKGEEEEEIQRNPKKRMWEENVEVEREQVVRDEL